MNTIKKRIQKLEGDSAGRGSPQILVVMPGETLEEVKAKQLNPIDPDDDVQVLGVVFVAPKTRLT